MTVSVETFSLGSGGVVVVHSSTVMTTISLASDVSIPPVLASSGGSQSGNAGSGKSSAAPISYSSTDTDAFIGTAQVTAVSECSLTQSYTKLT